MANWPQRLTVPALFLDFCSSSVSLSLISACLLCFFSSSSILSVSFHRSSRLGPPSESKWTKSDIVKQLVWLVQLYCCNAVTAVCFIQDHWYQVHFPPPTSSQLYRWFWFYLSTFQDIQWWKKCVWCWKILQKIPEKEKKKFVLNDVTLWKCYNSSNMSSSKLSSF